MTDSAASPSHLPAPTPELMLLLALVQAHTRSMSRKERERFLLDVSLGLGMQKTAYNVLRFRPRSEDSAVHRAMDEAQAWWRQAVSVTVRLHE